jgi:hypothetical protein
MANRKTLKKSHKLTIYQVPRCNSVPDLESFYSGSERPSKNLKILDADPLHGIFIRSQYTLKQCCGSGSASALAGAGSRRAKITHRKGKKKKECHNPKCSMFSFEG